MCRDPPPLGAVARAIEIRAGLRWESGRERMRERRAVPRVQAVEAVKVLKVWEGLVSSAMRTAGCAGC